jgi:hypothetical protein
MRAREIKDLSIAMEALSRIAGYDAEKLSGRIKDILADVLNEEETKSPLPPKPTDDEIPF